MSDDDHINRVKRPRSNDISTWFSRKSDQPSSCSSSQASISTPIAIEVTKEPSSESALPSSVRNEFDPLGNVNAIERDPGKRCPIWKYPTNQREAIRKAYIALGPFQPKLKRYPSSLHGAQNRKFNFNWFEDHPWLEYSVDQDKIYCFPCFLFDKENNPHQVFTMDGLRNWKDKNVLKVHMGGIESTHSEAMEEWYLLRNLATEIERVFVKRTAKEVEHNRLRLKAAIEAVRFLANQGLAFRGHDESESSFNAGNYKEVKKSYERMASDDDRLILQNGPGNAKYTSPSVQKQLLNIIGNKVRKMICEELGDAKFCILVDEAVDTAGKEQMSIVLRFVDHQGFIRERFFKIVSVPNTTSLTLKNAIVEVLGMFELQVSNMRGQGYDGASNMSGIWNGLQALFLEDCPYAYYVHCFAHRLQLALNGAAKGVHDTCRFFSTLLLVVNFIDSSAKRKGALKAARNDEIEDLTALNTLQTGTGSNQTCTLQRPAATRWSSHFRSIRSLIELFGSTVTTLYHIMDTATLPIQGEASGILKAMRTFEFVFCFILMDKVMRVTEVLCQAVQQKTIDIGEAMKFVIRTKEILQDMRDDGWDDLVMAVASFCETHNIVMPDMSARWFDGTGRPCQQKNFITNGHHYRVEVFNAVLDFQLSELNKRFNDKSCELLMLTSTLDPHDKFSLFETQKVLLLAKKFYPQDFMQDDLLKLELECAFYKKDMTQDVAFHTLDSMSDMCRLLVQRRKSDFYPMIYRLICLVLTLPVSTATTERAFSSMNIIKNKLRNRIEDDFLDDCMVLHIEKELAEAVDNDYVINEFEALATRRVRFT